MNRSLPDTADPISAAAASGRQQALNALLLQTADAKQQCIAHMQQQLSTRTPAEQAAWWDTDRVLHTLHTPDSLPGRPEKPVLQQRLDMPQRSLTTYAGLAALLHAVAHIEFNAINLALDAIWRFPSMPPDYYSQWLQVAAEEALHFSLLQALLHRLGYSYGSFPAHRGLWNMVERTSHCVTARMALVPRTLEARGLDATPPMQNRLRRAGTPVALEAVKVLDIILRDEIGHVQVGNSWYGFLCRQQGLEPVAHYRHLTRKYRAPRLLQPLNTAAREQAGFTREELDGLLLQESRTGAGTEAGTQAGSS